LVGVRVLGQVLILRDLPCHDARLEQVPYTGYAPDVIDRCRGVTVIPRDEWELVLIAETRVDRQVFTGAPLILDEAAELVQLAALHTGRQVHILPAVLVQTGVRSDRADSPGQNGIQRTRVGEVRA